MRRTVARLLLLFLVVALCTSVYAQQRYPSYKQQTRAARKAAKKQNKAGRKYGKQQQKAMRKSMKDQQKALKRARKRSLR
jgi:uncharacterized protein HemX